MDNEFGSLAPEQDPRSRSPWLQQGVAVATLEEICYADPGVVSQATRSAAVCLDDRCRLMPTTK